MSINEDIMTLVNKSEAKDKNITHTETDLKRKFNKITGYIAKTATAMKIDSRPENAVIINNAIGHIEAAMRAYSSKTLGLDSKVAIAWDSLEDAERCFN